MKFTLTRDNMTAQIDSMGAELVSLVKNYISGTTYTFCIKNLSNSAIKVKLGIYIPYRKNLS